MDPAGSLFNLSPEQSRTQLIGHLGDFLSVFPLYSEGERAGEFAAEAGAMILLHAAVLSGERSDNPLTSHLFLAGTSILAFSNPQLFAKAVQGAQGQEIKQWLNDFAGAIEAFSPLPKEDPILAAPNLSYEFLDCAALGALHKSLEALDEHAGGLRDEAHVQTALGVVLLEVAVAYDQHMGHMDHALAAWGALAILATGDAGLPPSTKVPYEYQGLLVNYLHSLADSYGLAKDFAFLFR